MYIRKKFKCIKSLNSNLCINKNAQLNFIIKIPLKSKIIQNIFTLISIIIISLMLIYTINAILYL